MDQNIKQRLVGITVIFSLAVIFLPMLLDGEGIRKETVAVDIPEQPELDGKPEFQQKMIELNAKVAELPSIQPELIDALSATKPAEDEQQPNSVEKVIESKIETVAPAATQKAVEKPLAKTIEKQKPEGASWVLQIGSFEDYNKAILQRDKLQKSNIAAVFVEQFDAGSKSSFRVRLGPFTSRNLSKIAQQKVKAKHHIDGLIMKYEK